MLIATILLSVALAAGAQIVLKLGMERVTEASGVFSPTSVSSLKSAAVTPLVWAGLVVFALSALVWLAVLSRASLSFAYPFASLTYVIILFYGRFIADEPVSAMRWGGVVLIIGGILLVSQTPTN
ncbi:MAG: 4-amino-4-deoxy-L-arabinose transferase [Actinobacteria bacterium]|nr:4-amino-4-deoxy-L-arabinose transferase [Actinomycetota bacterium]